MNVEAKQTSSLLILASSSWPGVPVNCIVFFNWFMSSHDWPQV